ncbi:high mobility group nucleosome-binding domain-containing protein 3 [Rhinophrynus dorsalis]
MPKRKSPEGAETKDAAKVTKQEFKLPDLDSGLRTGQIIRKAEIGVDIKEIFMNIVYCLKDFLGIHSYFCLPDNLSGPQTRIQKEPASKANKGAKGKKEEKPEAAKEGTTPPENGETRADEIRISRSTVNVSTSRGALPSTLSIKGQIETVKVKGTEN